MNKKIIINGKSFILSDNSYELSISKGKYHLNDQDTGVSFDENSVVICNSDGSINVTLKIPEINYDIILNGDNLKLETDSISPRITSSGNIKGVKASVEVHSNNGDVLSVGANIISGGSIKGVKAGVKVNINSNQSGKQPASPAFENILNRHIESDNINKVLDLFQRYEFDLDKIKGLCHSHSQAMSDLLRSHGASNDVECDQFDQDQSVETLGDAS